MYDKSAAYYDIIYSFKNYQEESERLHRIIQQQKKSTGNDLLDVACGTGNHITYLKRRYNVEGLDINPDLLRIARAKHPDIIFHKEDMRSFRLGKKFDVVTCLFSAIGHVKTETKMRSEVKSMAQHLKPGGLLVVEPWFGPHQWNVGHLSANFVDKPDLKLARLSMSKRRRNLSLNDEHHLVASPKGIEYFVERLELGLFTREDYIDAFRKAKLDPSFDEEGLIGRGLYFGARALE